MDIWEIWGGVRFPLSNNKDFKNCYFIIGTPKVRVDQVDLVRF